MILVRPGRRGGIIGGCEGGVVYEGEKSGGVNKDILWGSGGIA